MFDWRNQPNLADQNILENDRVLSAMVIACGGVADILPISTRHCRLRLHDRLLIFQRSL
jgi:hypothetical protein